MQDNQGVTPSGPGSRASHDASKLSSPKASIPNACPRCKGSGEHAMAGGPLAPCGFCGGSGQWRLTFKDDRSSDMAAVAIAGAILAIVPVLVLIAALSKFG